MKPPILILIIYFSSLALYGQDSTKIYSLIDNYSQNSNEEFIIAQEMWPNQLNRLLNSLKPNISDSDNNRIELTGEELKFIKNELETTGDFKWSKKFLKTTTIIPLDSLKQNTTYYRPYWLFSQPIFIRNNSVALLYSIYYCGTTCGYSDLSFYIWQKDKYVRWVRVTGGKG